jgi:hypothetical protein
MGTAGLPLPLTDFHLLLLHLKRFLAGKMFDSEDELKEIFEKWLRYCFCEQGIPTLCHVTRRASLWVVLMSKGRLYYVEFDSNE